MMSAPGDSVAEFQGFLKGAVDSIDELDRLPDSPSGEARMRHCASIVGETGLQAIHAGFADLHDRSLQFPPFVERTAALAFIADCVARCREAAATHPGGTVSERPGMMTAEEVSDYLGITVRSVRRRVLDGTLPQPVKIGRSVRFRREDIEAVAAGK